MTLQVFRRDTSYWHDANMCKQVAPTALYYSEKGSVSDTPTIGIECADLRGNKFFAQMSIRTLAHAMQKIGYTLERHDADRK